MSLTASPKRFARKAWVAVRFVLFGFFGFLVMLLFSVFFIARVFEHDPHFLSPFLSLPLAALGSVMMLYEVGEWGRWAYLCVFLSIPISLFLLPLVAGTGSSKELPVIVAAVAAVGSCVGV